MWGVLVFAKLHIALCLQGNKWDELRRVGYEQGIRRKFWSRESHLASSSTNIVGWDPGAGLGLVHDITRALVSIQSPDKIAPPEAHDTDGSFAVIDLPNPPAPSLRSNKLVEITNMLSRIQASKGICPESLILPTSRPLSSD